MIQAPQQAALAASSVYAPAQVHERYPFKPRLDGHESSREQMDARLEDLEFLLSRLSVEERRIERPIVARQIAKDELENVLLHSTQRARTLEANAARVQRRFPELSRDIPCVSHPFRADIPGLHNRFTTCRVKFFDINRRIVHLRTFLEDRTFQATLKLLQKKAVRFQEIVEQGDFASRVKDFEDELQECELYFAGLPELPDDTILYEVVCLEKSYTFC